MDILLAGRGSLGQAVKQHCREHHIPFTEMAELDMGNDSKNPIDIALYCGIGNLFWEMFHYCNRRKIPLINASTNTEHPTSTDTIYVKAQNTCITMLKLMAGFAAFAEPLMKELHFSILESHQARKKSVSGTAKFLAEAVGADPVSRIEMVRSPVQQVALGIPTEDLNGHAYHFFNFTSSNIEIQLATKIRGRRPYAEGAIKLAETLLAHKGEIAPGIHSATDFLKYM